ncbi:DUF2637 domain-containing protein [Streptomyces sp. NPDC052179]|uniref:DUF2637 domain-containing protein n=1 Tax=Streptomyces sp. NPDC052179 TaxID=3155680 RepID=UPI0034237A2F
MEDLVKKGRSVGILVILISQKTTGDAIPTFIRDVCPIGLSFAQKTVEAAVAALGDDIRNWPDASPVTLQDPAYVGVAVMAMQGRPGYTRIRTPIRLRRRRGPRRRSHLAPDCRSGPVPGRPSRLDRPDHGTPAVARQVAPKAHTGKDVEDMTEERFTRRTVTVVMAVIAALAFVFSFGNVWALALRLGVPRPIAPLIAPMVDLSVVGLLVALRFLALRGVPKAELKAGTRLLHLCGLLTLALNTAEPLLTGRYGRACLDTVAPLLLLGLGHVGPAFLAQFHTHTQHLEATAATQSGTPDARPADRRLPDRGAGARSGRHSAGRRHHDRRTRFRPCPSGRPAGRGPAHRGHPPRRARNTDHRRPPGHTHGHRPAGGHGRTRSALSPGPQRPHPPC